MDRQPEPTWTDVMSAFSALTTAVLTAALLWAAWKAWKTSKQAVDAAKKANEQAKRDSIERTRPYVFAEIVGSLAGNPNWDLRITNMGNSAARDLTLTFDPWPEELDDIATKIKEMFETPRTLPPRASLRVYWRLQAKRDSTFEDGTTEAGMPLAGTITATYTSDDPARPTYTDSYEVLIDTSGFMPVPEDGVEPKGMKGSLQQFYSVERAIARHLGELRR